MSAPLPSQPLIEHLIELKRRVIIAGAAWMVAVLGCYLVIEPIYAFLVEPLAAAFDGEQRRLIYTSLTETFFTYMKLACYSGLFVAFPVIAVQFYLFLAPGLYKRERGVLAPYLIISPLLFVAGAALAYYGVMPMAWKFFVGFEGASGALPIQLEAKVSEYLSIVIQIIFAFGLAFQMPIALTLLTRMGTLKAETLANGRKYAVVILLTVAAVLTPPDVLSQIALFIPLYMLYELSIISCRMIEKKHAQQ